MADKFIKWPISGGWAFGKVISNTDEKTKVYLPSGQTVEIANTEISEVTESEYKESVKKLALNILTEAGVNIMNQIEELQTELTNVKAELTETQTKLTNVEKSLADEIEAKKTAENKAKDMEKKMQDTTCEKEAVEAKLAEIEKARLGEARFNELGKEAAFAALKTEDVTEASNKLAEMNEASFDMIKNLSQSFMKSTDQTQTSLPKSTDQTKTGLTKSTDAEEVEIEEAKVESDDSALSSVATSENSNDFSLAMSKLLGVKE